jgi:hypothetical protein
MGAQDRMSRRGWLRIGVAAAVGTWITTAQAASPEAKLDTAAAEEITRDWPGASKAVAKEMLQKYGAPQEATPTMLIWRSNGPWKRTIVHKEGIEHAFPTPHRDVLEQTVEYKVPLNFYNALASYNGSLIADRTRGELTAFCDSEATNMLSLNLAQDILRGRITAEQAREAYAQALRELQAGKPPETMQTLTIPPPQGDLADPDTPAVLPAGARKP